MAEVNATLFFKGNRTYSVGAITFDLLLSENHNRSNIVTERKVEEGAAITDHIRQNLQTGNLTGLISNFSIRTEGLFSNRAQDAFDELERLMDSGELVTIATIMKVYENVAITNVSVARNASTGEAISLNVSFKQVRIVKLQEVQVDVSISVTDMGSDLDRQASPQLDAGRTVGQ